MKTHLPELTLQRAGVRVWTLPRVQVFLIWQLYARLQCVVLWRGGDSATEADDAIILSQACFRTRHWFSGESSVNSRRDKKKGKQKKVALA